MNNCPCELISREECSICKDTDKLKGEQRKMNTKEEEYVDELEEMLGDCLNDLCRLCVIINPQHSDCEQCDDTDRYREAIK